MNNQISLSELNNSVKKTLFENFSDTYKITAEISEIRQSKGHVYLELIEKNKSDKMLAKARAVIWAYTYRMLKPYFQSITGHSLEAGLKILVLVSVEFHEVFGYTLNIKDIDPTYTIGDIKRKRIAIIRKLESEGIAKMNKELEIPAVPQKIAVISSKTAAGYEDFVNHLENNELSYKFYIKLFPAIMQGEQTETSIINALEQVYEHENLFDLLVIIRGGGSKSDLSWFDSYELAFNIAQFPLPVITGIGHERDESIADIMANTSLKTPTAVAEFIISRVKYFDNYLNNLYDNFMLSTKNILGQNKNKLEHFAYILKPLIKTVLQRKENELNLLTRKTQNICKEYIASEKYKLDLLEQKNNFINPKNILARGYSYTILNGKLLTKSKDVKKGDIIKTQMIDGSFKSVITD